jgi:hypothetical protein
MTLESTAVRRGTIAIALALVAVTAAASDDLHRVRGDAVLWTDGVGRIALAVDLVGPDGFGDGRTDELYLLAPEGDEVVPLAPRAVSGEIVWSKSGGFVRVLDDDGTPRWTMTTGRPDAGRADRVGVELVRIAGRFETSPWTIDTSSFPSTRTAGSEIGTSDPCQSGGVGAVSCSRRCVGLPGGAGGTSCDVTCGSGYHACCNCIGGLVAQCYCRIAPRDDIKTGPKPTPVQPCKDCTF